MDQPFDIDTALKQGSRAEPLDVDTVLQQKLQDQPFDIDSALKDPRLATRAVESPAGRAVAKATAWGATKALKGVSAGLGILEPLQYPQRALASSYEAAARGDELPLRAAWEGLMGRRDWTPADVARMPRGESTDTWGGWLEKEVPRLGVNMFTDPLLALGWLGKVAKARPAVQSAIKALEPVREWGGGTIPARMFARRSPHSEKGDLAESFIEQADQLGRRMEMENEALYKPAKVAAEWARKDEPLVRQLAEAERTGAEYMPLNASMIRGLPLEAVQNRVMRELWETGDKDLPVYLSDAWKAQHARSAALREQHNALAQEMGAPTIGFTPEDDTIFTPRPSTPRGERRTANMPTSTGKGRGVLSPEKFSSRTLLKATDPVTGKPILSPEGMPYVRNFASMREPEMAQFLKDVGRSEVGTTEATLRDIERTLPDLFGTVVADPGVAYLLNQATKAKQIKILDLMKKLRDNDLVYDFTPGSQFNKSSLPSSMVGTSRNLRIPGLEQMGAPKWLANRLENYSGVPTFGEGTTWLGRAARDYTGNWKRNVLGLWPAYHSGNEITNQQLIYSGALPYGGKHATIDPSDWGQRFWQAVSYPGQHIRNLADAYRVQSHSMNDVFPGMINYDLAREIEARGGLGAGIYGGESIPEALGKETSSRTRALMERLANFAESRTPGAGGEAMEVLGPVANFAEGWGRANQAGLRFGTKLEDNSRIAVILDYLKKMGFDPRTMSETERNEMLDKAVKYGRDIMVPYDNATPFEQKYLNSLIWPFWNWNRGVTQQLAGRVMEDPARMARYGRFHEAMIEPLTEEEQAAAPEWMQRDIITKRIGGYPFGKDEAGNQVILPFARLSPYANVTDFLNPLHWGGFLNPGIKGLYALAGNQDIDKGGLIDPEAGPGFLSGVKALVKPYISDDPDYSRSWANTLFWRPPKMTTYQARTLLPVSRALNFGTQRLVNQGIANAPRMTPLSGLADIVSTVTGIKLMPLDIERYRRGASAAADHAITRAENYIKEGVQYSDSPEEMARLQKLWEQRNREKQRTMGMLD